MVRETPSVLRYKEIEYDHSLLTPAMLHLVNSLDDELSNITQKPDVGEDVSVRMLYPHLRAGTLPPDFVVQPFFPTAYEAPRIRFMLVDGDLGDRIPWLGRQGWWLCLRFRDLVPGARADAREYRPCQQRVNSWERLSSRQIPNALAGIGCEPSWWAPMAVWYLPC